MRSSTATDQFIEAFIFVLFHVYSRASHGGGGEKARREGGGGRRQ